MHRSVPLCAVLLLGLCLSAAFAQSPEYLTILHLNDTHSNLAAGAPRDAEGNPTAGGVARAGTIIMQEKASDPNVLVLHAGDVFIGDPSFNLSVGAATPVIPELQMLLQLGVEAMAVGNHEFDLGPKILLGLLAASFDESSFPLLSANLDYSEDPENALQAFVSPHVILQKGDVKVGIFGMTTPEVEETGTSHPIIVSDDLGVIAGEQVAALRGEGCDVVIMLSHLLHVHDMEVAANVPGIDLIVGAHDHYAFKEPVEIPNAGGMTPIVQCGAFYRSMGKTVLKIDNGVVSVESYDLIALDETVGELGPLQTACADIYAQLDAATGGLLMATVGAATGDFSEEILDCTAEGNLDTHVGNLCADAYAAATGADFAFQPGGSTAQPIHAGPIKALDLFRTIGYGMNGENGMGFGLVTVKMTGTAILAGLEATLGYIPLNDEALIHPSDGFSYAYNPQAEEGHRVHTLNFNGAPLDLEATYTVAFNEYLLMYLMYFASADPRIVCSDTVFFDSPTMDGPLTEFEALAGYVMNLQTLTPEDPLPGRVTSLVTSTGHGATLPASPVLEQNFPNPFAGGTVVRLTMPSSLYARVTVHDAIGREVAVLAEREFRPGVHQLQFHADGLPAGLYFCRLLTGGQQQAIRMMHTR